MSNEKRSPAHSLHNYAYYSNMGIEMGVIIALGVFGGIKLDQKLNCSPAFTITLSLAGVAIAMYVMIRTALRNPNKKQDEPKNTH